MFIQDAPGHILLMFEGWTSKIMTSYLAVTAHWLMKEWDLQSKLVAFSELNGIHSGENISGELYKVLKKYDICHKVPSSHNFEGS